MLRLFLMIFDVHQARYVFIILYILFIYFVFRMHIVGKNWRIRNFLGGTKCYLKGYNHWCTTKHAKVCMGRLTSIYIGITYRTCWWGGDPLAPSPWIHQWKGRQTVSKGQYPPERLQCQCSANSRHNAFAVNWCCKAFQTRKRVIQLKVQYLHKLYTSL